MHVMPRIWTLRTRQAVEEQVTALKPAVIYHCAAYTAVDKAEDEGKEINWRVNEEGTRNLAEVAVKVGAKLVYLSTDYVFDGTKTGDMKLTLRPILKMSTAKLSWLEKRLFKLL